MVSLRSLLACVLAALTVVLVGCSSPNVAQAPTYTPTQIEQIQRNTASLQQMRDRMPELATAISQRNWSDIQSFIHGPLGELRFRTANLARNLLSPADKEASEVAKELYNHLVKIDEAAIEQNGRLAAQQYREALQDFDRFLQLVSDVA